MPADTPRERPLGLTRRTLVATAWAAPVIAFTAATPAAAASTGSELTAWLVTTCGAPDRLTLNLRNDTTEPLQTYLELTADGEQPSAGPGPVLAPGETRAFGFGLLPNGGWTVGASTAGGLRFRERTVLSCPPLGLDAQTASADGTLTVLLRNDDPTPKDVRIEFDLDGDGVADTTDTLTLAGGEERAVPYPIPTTDFTVRVATDGGYALVESFAFA